jgi:2-succinyl-5-enolpyruvyl-6-hydroxy-3-cyclohexene-1-carboxylate synthase
LSTSIDPDFLINGNLGGIFSKAIAEEGVDENSENVFDRPQNADINTLDLGGTGEVDLNQSPMKQLII